MKSINTENVFVQLINGKIQPYYGPDFEYEDIVMKVLMPTIRPFTQEERQRAMEKAIANGVY